MASRMASLICRTESRSQSMWRMSGRAPPARRPDALPSRNLPRDDLARTSFPRPVAVAERGAERDPLVGDGHGVPGLGNDERLQAERVLCEADRVRGRRQVAEASVQLTHGVEQRLTECGALAELAREVEPDHLGVVLGVKAQPLLLVHPP